MKNKKYSFEIKLPTILPLKKSEHFNIYYYPNSCAEREIEQITLQREKAYADISNYLNTDANFTIDLYLFDDCSIKETETQHKGAGWAFDRVMVEMYNESTKCHPYHELIHIFADQIYGTTVSFFSEGLAVFISDRLYGGYDFHKNVKTFHKNNELFTLDKMFSFQIGESISKPQISYPEAASIIEYLYGLIGKEKFFMLYKSLKDDYTDKGIASNIQTFERHCGKTVKQINQEWLKFIQNVYGKRRCNEIN